MTRVLVFGDDTRSFLTTVRSLGRRGYRVDVIPQDWSSPALCSRFIGTIYRLPPYALASDAWVNALNKILQATPYDLLIPCDERAILPLKHHLQDLGNPPLAIVNDAAFEPLFDKYLTRNLAQSVGVPVARGKLLEIGDSAQGLIALFGLPLALKPRKSFELDSLHHRGAVRICATEPALEGALDAVACQDDHLVEGYFDGVGVGVSVLAKDGRLLQVFQHRRVREPRSGGGSSYRKSEAVSPPLLDATEKISKAVQLTGLAMFEYRENPATKDFILLEVNARLWGSIPLPVAAGVDFPYHMTRLMIAGEEGSPAPYKTPQYARNLRTDLDGLLNDVIAHGRAALGDAARSVFGYRRWLLRGEASDTKAADDPEVHRRDMADFRADLCQRVRKKIGPLRRADANTVRDRVKSLLQKPGPKRICFLCFGNICRSPLAEEIARHSVPPGADSITFFSAGTLPKRGRKTPKNGLKAAAARGYSLDQHRSSHVTDFAPDMYDIIFHFDPRIEQDWHRIGWGPKAPIFNMASLIDPPGRSVVIEDPYGKDLAEFDACYQTVETAVGWIMEQLSAKS